MKNILSILILISSMFALGQKKSKEIVYLLFDNTSVESCIVEDGSGNSNNLKKFRKELIEDYIYFRICDEVFISHKIKSFKKVFLKTELDELKIVSFDYLRNKLYDSEEFKHQVFGKVYFIEEINNDKFCLHEVTWIDNILMTED